MTTEAAVNGSIDPFFEMIPDGDWNACVGRQGSVLNYVDGYLEAARELIAAVIDKRLFASRDTLAMPILYNTRHGLELALKFVIDRLHGMGMIASTHPVDHDIRSHWRHLQEARIGDLRLRELVAELEPFVISLAGIDGDGQELRYALNRGGGRSLESLAVVNLPLIRRSIDAMSAILGRIKTSVLDLEDDRPTGTHTIECSRRDLKAIAALLGHQSTWRDPSFDDGKREAMSRFGLSGRKFSDAVDAIRGSRPLAASVGIESPLRHLGDDRAVAALELWAKVHPPAPDDATDPGTDYFERDRTRMIEGARKARELYDAIIVLLTPEEFADVQTVFYIGRDRVQGEFYDEYLDGTIAEHSAGRDRRQIVHHIMSKTNLLDAMVDGATAVGRPSLAIVLRQVRPE